MRLVGLIIFLIPLTLLGQHSIYTSRTEVLDAYVRNFTAIDGNSHSIPDLTNFITTLEQKNLPKNGSAFCNTIFQKARNKFLKRYSEFATFNETLGSGKYNCLTGTALYALLLDYFKIDYSIVETNYHIFLLAHTDEGTVLLEATDPARGFVSDSAEVEKRILQYKQNVIQRQNDDKRYYEYTFDLYKTVTLDQIKGLMHYNLSVDAYNQQNFESSIQHLSKALDFYNSPRISEFSSILLLTLIDNSKLDIKVRDSYLRSIQALRKKRATVMASRN